MPLATWTACLGAPWVTHCLFCCSGFRLNIQADPSDPAYASGDLDSPVGCSTGRAGSGSLHGADSGQLSSQRSIGGMLSVPTFKAQRRRASGDLGSEVGLVGGMFPMLNTLGVSFGGRWDLEHV